MKKKNPKKVTMRDYLAAQEEAVMGMVETMRSLNQTEEDEETMCMMLDLILQVTTRIQGILFGDEVENLEAYEIIDPLVVIEEGESHDG